MAAAISRLSWNEGERNAYLDFARLAACIEDRNESRLRSYFQVACFLHQEDQAMRWLQKRTQSLPLHGDPFMTLSWAFEQIQKPSEALRVLEEALIALPDDGVLHAYAAHKFSAFGKTERAKQLLEFARNKCPDAMYHRTAAAIDMDAGNLQSAREHLNTVLEIDPLDMGTLDRLMQVDHDLDGPVAARNRLNEALSKFPSSYAFRAASVSWIRQNEPIAADNAIDSMLNDFPQDPWAMREAAIIKMQRHEWAAAAEFARHAIEFEPKYSRNWALLGRCQQELGEFTQAKSSYQESIRCSVDDPYPMRPLFDLCATPEERREVLDLIYNELANQTTYGDGVSGFYELAVGRMPFDELIAKLERAKDERGDLPQTWSCLVDVYCRLHRIEEAMHTATKATELFPLHVGAWIDLAAAQRTAGDFDASLATLEHAQTIGITNPQVAKQLSELYRSRKQWDKADEVLARTLESNPRDGVLLAFRAETLWDLGQHDQAIETMERSVVLLPNYDWAWNTLSAWCRERQQWKVLQRAAQSMIETRPNQVRGYLRAADAAIEESDLSEALSWIEKALAIDPRCVDAYHLKAWALSLAGQHQAALDATQPEVFRDAPSPPLLLTRSELHFSQGDLAGAIKARKESVRLDPDNYNGWRRLMAWTDQGTDADLHEESARNCIRLAPNNVDGYGYLSGALLAKGEKDEAKQLLAEAILREPGYEYAVQTLFDLRLKDGELEAAKSIRDQSLEHVSPELSQSMTTRILLEDNQSDEAFEQLCVMAEGPVRMWGILYQTVDSWKKPEDLYSRCSDRLAVGSANETLGRIWARTRIATKTKNSLIRTSSVCRNRRHGTER
jgi:cellulose synthase operon protein C